MENINYTPKIGELVFTNCGSGGIKRDNDKLIPWYRIRATFRNDKNRLFSVEFCATGRTPYEYCSCTESTDRTLQEFCETRNLVWLNRIQRIRKAKEKISQGFLHKNNTEKKAVLAYLEKANRIVIEFHALRCQQPYTDYGNLRYFASDDGKLRSHEYPYDYQTILSLVNKVFGCSYKSIKTIASLPFDTVCRCK